MFAWLPGPSGDIAGLELFLLKRPIFATGAVEGGVEGGEVGRGTKRWSRVHPQGAQRKTELRGSGRAVGLESQSVEH